MNSHKNARTTYGGRKLLIERIAVMGVSPAAQAAGISVSTARKWKLRFACLREWAYLRSYENSDERTAVLPAFLNFYNARRPHSALGSKPPASRLGGNNLLQLNS